jgi:hypothetical protein
MSYKPKIPSWQRAPAEKPDTQLPADDQQSEPAEQPERSTSPISDAPTPTESDLEEVEPSNLLDQAKRFLHDATIRDAPWEKKVAFLESKGVSAEDIDTLLGSGPQEEPSDQLEDVRERAWSTVSIQKSTSVALSLFTLGVMRQDHLLTSADTTKASRGITTCLTTCLTTA